MEKNIDEAIYDAIKELFFLVDDGDRRLFAKYNLTVPRFYALKHIFDSPGLSPVQLSGRMFCDKSNITRLLKGLESEGFVSRVKHEHDRRSVRLFLTESGEVRCREAANAHEQYNAQRFRFVADQIEPTELVELFEFLRHGLTESLHQADPVS